MKRVFKIAGFGLLTGAAVTLAGAAMADRGPMGPRGQMGAMRPAPVSFAELDVDGNGQITEADLAARAEARFSDADANGDGSLTLEELVAAGIARFDDTRAARQQAAAPGAVVGRPSDAQVTARAERMASRMLQRADADGNGTIEAAEMGAGRGMSRLFDRADADGDGAITEAEFDAAREEMAARLHERHEGMGRHGDGDERPWGRGDRH
jgi:Ca2+-binding EF-hand superfamily protein